MTHYTRLQEDPSRATLTLLRDHPSSRVELIAAGDGYGRIVVIRPVSGAVDAVHVCAGDNPLFVANVIVLTHAHNARIDARSPRTHGDGI